MLALKAGLGYLDVMAMPVTRRRRLVLTLEAAEKSAGGPMRRR